MTQKTGSIWLFDGVCVLCSRSVQFLLRHERQPDIIFVAIQSALGQDLARTHNIDPDNPESFLLIENEVAYAKSDGLIKLAGHLRSPWHWLSSLRFVPRSLRDIFYDFLARNRYQFFGKRESCMMPEANTRNRFVLPENAKS